jgi:hypothetical protein
VRVGWIKEVLLGLWDMPGFAGGSEQMWVLLGFEEKQSLLRVGGFGKGGLAQGS